MFEVKIKVDNEAELYNPFDPEEQMINGDIIDYIFEKIMEKEIRDKLLRLMLSGRVPELLSEIVSTVGAFSLWEAASIWIVENPSIRLRKARLQMLSNTEVFVSVESSR